MRVAIVHYHLAAGGVTSVIRAASQALMDAGIGHVILSGQPAGGESGISWPADSPVRQVPGLGYLSSPGDLPPVELLENLRETAAGALGAAPDVWHFHNPTLGKNVLLPEVIQLLAAAGERLVLQLHDLAEQGRPANYPLIAGHPELYPYNRRIRYAFLNSRDREIFLQAGLPPDNALLLPNPVPLPSPPLASCATTPLLFAPIRGIRRKNLGELVLLSALVPAGSRIATSRSPHDPEALLRHDAWQAFARDQRLPVEFAVVDRLTPEPDAGTGFESWISHASHFVTTSVQEGFGLPFLEAIAHGKPLIGRNLSHLTADHARQGIRTGDFYDRLLIPAEWVDLKELREHLADALTASRHAYRRPLSLSSLETVFENLAQDGHLDFGNLPEPFQRHIIRRIRQENLQSVPWVETGDGKLPAISWLAAALANRSPTAGPEQLEPWSIATYQRRITTLYSELSSAPNSPVQHVSPEAILTAHLGPGSFHFLLTTSRTPVRFRAVVFDIYGTLLDAAAGGIKPDPAADPRIAGIIRRFGFNPPPSPSQELHGAVVRHHAAADCRYPEVDLRELWREILGIPPETDTAPLVEAIEAAWHPATLMPGAEDLVNHLARSGIPLGLLSNAQCNTLGSLGAMAERFAADLTVLSYQYGIAKPSPELFRLIVARLGARGISPSETLFVGNDPLHDIIPAAAAGMRTALFTGRTAAPSDSCPDYTFARWAELRELFPDDIGIDGQPATGKLPA